MIELELNRQDFEYDIYSLVKAFYPDEEVSVFLEDGSSPENSANERHNAWKIRVHYEDRKVEVIFAGENGDGQPASEDKTVGTDVVPGGSSRMEEKSVIKTLLYRMLSERTGRVLPWGDLTGIRPVKIAMTKLEEGWSNARIAGYMRDQFHVSVPKSALAVMIANREKYLLDRLAPREGYSLYIGIPFCPSVCLYCSFSSGPVSRWHDQTDAYVDALLLEMRECAGLFAQKKLQTVYIGGGTPTTLTTQQLDRVLCGIENCFDLRHVKEFTVEAGRPDSITREKLAVLRAHGIGRISINPQTMNQRTLDLIGRKHTVEEFVEAFSLAREMGFDNINTDLIIGLPREGLPEVAHTMQRIGELSPESVTVHALALKRAARLSLMKDLYRPVSFQASEEIMNLTMRANEARGLAPYYLYRQKNIAGNFENVGYALEGKECLYNILIMEEVQSILALGAGGSTKLVFRDGHIERIENVKDILHYLQRTGEMIERKKRIIDLQEEL